MCSPFCGNRLFNHVSWFSCADYRRSERIYFLFLFFFLSFFFIISFLFLKFISSNYSENNCPTTMHSFHSRPSSEFSGLFDIRFRLEIKWCQRVSFGEWVIFFLLQFKRARACNRSGKKGSLRQKRGDSEGAFTIDKRAKVEQSRASSMAITDNESGQTL